MARLRLKEQERAVENIWARVSGIVLSEARLLWDKGYDVEVSDLMKGLQRRLNEAIDEEGFNAQT